MKKPERPQSASEAQRPRLIRRSRQYVDVNDLRQMLKLGLGLHTVGDPSKRLTNALNGLARMALADAWVAMVLDPKTNAASAILTGGKNLDAAKAMLMRVESECHRANTTIGGLIARPGKPPGRVRAIIDEPAAILSILRHETHARRVRPLTWISVHRAVGSTPLAERERRLVEMFHSQSAWLLVKLTE